MLERGDWQAAHPLVQQDEEDPLYCWAHGIAHVQEGDLENARYWYGEAKRAYPEPYDLHAELQAQLVAAERPDERRGPH